MGKIAVSGSFDPITKGHLFVIERAMDLSNDLTIIVADNPSKKYTFTAKERMDLIDVAIKEFCDWGKIKSTKINIVVVSENKFVAQYLQENNIKTILRGLRNVVDFEYEHSLAIINKQIAPDVQTLFVMPPTDMIAVSSSAIKGMVGIENWEKVAEKYVTNSVLNGLKEKHE